MAEDDRIEIPESAKESLRVLLAQRRQINNDINVYIKALQDTFGIIQGSGWLLEINEIAFIKQSPNGKVDEEDVVGAITGYNAGG